MSLDKKAFDCEYSTQWRREYEYLLAIGIKPSFVKTNKETGIRTYKYTKTPGLFLAAYAFYTAVKAEQEWGEIDSYIKAHGELGFGEIPKEFNLCLL